MLSLYDWALTRDASNISNILRSDLIKMHPQKENEMMALRWGWGHTVGIHVGTCSDSLDKCGEDKLQYVNFTNTCKVTMQPSTSNTGNVRFAFTHTPTEETTVLDNDILRSRSVSDYMQNIMYRGRVFANQGHYMPVPIDTRTSSIDPIKHARRDTLPRIARNSIISPAFELWMTGNKQQNIRKSPDFNFPTVMDSCFDDPQTLNEKVEFLNGRCTMKAMSIKCKTAYSDRVMYIWPNIVPFTANGKRAVVSDADRDTLLPDQMDDSGILDLRRFPHQTNIEIPSLQLNKDFSLALAVQHYRTLGPSWCAFLFGNPRRGSYKKKWFAGKEVAEKGLTDTATSMLALFINGHLDPWIDRPPNESTSSEWILEKMYDTDMQALVDQQEVGLRQLHLMDPIIRRFSQTSSKFVTLRKREAKYILETSAVKPGEIFTMGSKPRYARILPKRLALTTENALKETVDTVGTLFPENNNAYAQHLLYGAVPYQPLVNLKRQPIRDRMKKNRFLPIMLIGPTDRKNLVFYDNDENESNETEDGMTISEFTKPMFEYYMENKVIAVPMKLSHVENPGRDLREVAKTMEVESMNDLELTKLNFLHDKGLQLRPSIEVSLLSDRLIRGFMINNKSTSYNYGKTVVMQPLDLDVIKPLPDTCTVTCYNSDDKVVARLSWNMNLTNSIKNKLLYDEARGRFEIECRYPMDVAMCNDSPPTEEERTKNNPMVEVDNYAQVPAYCTYVDYDLLQEMIIASKGHPFTMNAYCCDLEREAIEPSISVVYDAHGEMKAREPTKLTTLNPFVKHYRPSIYFDMLQTFQKHKHISECMWDCLQKGVLFSNDYIPLTRYADDDTPSTYDPMVLVFFSRGSFQSISETMPGVPKPQPMYTHQGPCSQEGQSFYNKQTNLAIGDKYKLRVKTVLSASLIPCQWGKHHRPGSLHPTLDSTQVNPACNYGGFCKASKGFDYYKMNMQVFDVKIHPFAPMLDTGMHIRTGNDPTPGDDLLYGDISSATNKIQKRFPPSDDSFYNAKAGFSGLPINFFTIGHTYAKYHSASYGPIITKASSIDITDANFVLVKADTDVMQLINHPGNRLTTRSMRRLTADREMLKSSNDKYQKKANARWLWEGDLLANTDPDLDLDRPDLNGDSDQFLMWPNTTSANATNYSSSTTSGYWPAQTMCKTFKKSAVLTQEAYQCKHMTMVHTMRCNSSFDPNYIYATYKPTVTPIESNPSMNLTFENQRAIGYVMKSVYHPLEETVTLSSSAKATLEGSLLPFIVEHKTYTDVQRGEAKVRQITVNIAYPGNPNNSYPIQLVLYDNMPIQQFLMQVLFALGIYEHNFGNTGTFRIDEHDLFDLEQTQHLHHETSTVYYSDNQANSGLSNVDAIKKVRISLNNVSFRIPEYTVELDVPQLSDFKFVVRRPRDVEISMLMLALSLCTNVRVMTCTLVIDTVRYGVGAQQQLPDCVEFEAMRREPADVTRMTYFDFDAGQVEIGYYTTIAKYALTTPKFTHSFYSAVVGTCPGMTPYQDTRTSISSIVCDVEYKPIVGLISGLTNGLPYECTNLFTGVPSQSLYQKNFFYEHERTLGDSADEYLLNLEEKTMNLPASVQKPSQTLGTLYGEGYDVLPCTTFDVLRSQYFRLHQHFMTKTKMGSELAWNITLWAMHTAIFKQVDDKVVYTMRAQYAYWSFELDVDSKKVFNREDRHFEFPLWFVKAIENVCSNLKPDEVKELTELKILDCKKLRHLLSFIAPADFIIELVLNEKGFIGDQSRPTGATLDNMEHALEGLSLYDYRALAHLKCTHSVAFQKCLFHVRAQLYDNCRDFNGINFKHYQFSNSIPNVELTLQTPTYKGVAMHPSVSKIVDMISFGIAYYENGASPPRKIAMYDCIKKAQAADEPRANLARKILGHILRHKNATRLDEKKFDDDLDHTLNARLARDADLSKLHTVVAELVTKRLNTCSEMSFGAHIKSLYSTTEPAYRAALDVDVAVVPAIIKDNAVTPEANPKNKELSNIISKIEQNARSVSSTLTPDVRYTPPDRSASHFGRHADERLYCQTRNPGTFHLPYPALPTYFPLYSVNLEDRDKTMFSENNATIIRDASGLDQNATFVSGCQFFTDMWPSGYVERCCAPTEQLTTERVTNISHDTEAAIRYALTNWKTDNIGEADLDTKEAREQYVLGDDASEGLMTIYTPNNPSTPHKFKGLKVTVTREDIDGKSCNVTMMMVANITSPKVWYTLYTESTSDLSMSFQKDDRLHFLASNGGSVHDMTLQKPNLQGRVVNKYPFVSH